MKKLELSKQNIIVLNLEDFLELYCGVSEGYPADDPNEVLLAYTKIQCNIQHTSRHKIHKHKRILPTLIWSWKLRTSVVWQS